MKETTAITTKMMNPTSGSPWSGCLAVPEMSPASAALATVTPPNHAATLPPQSTTESGYRHHPTDGLLKASLEDFEDRRRSEAANVGAN
jgi:hypothetical protein